MKTQLLIVTTGKRFDSLLHQVMNKVLFVCAVAFLMAGHNPVNAQATGELWGVTYSGGQDDLGVIFKTAADGTGQIVKNSFTYTVPGSFPKYTKFIQASNGKLYAMTRLGGSSGKGILLEYDLATNLTVSRVDFNGSNGANPEGSLLQATNGKLYGMTTAGGANNIGVLFEYTISTNSYVKKIDFAGFANGSLPSGSLMQATNGKLYGMATQGGDNARGCIFEYDIATNTLTKKYSFDPTNGAYPYGDLVQAANGKLYGMTQHAGTSSNGVIFEYDPVSAAWAKKIDFTGAANGALPTGSLIRASNNKLYGMTYNGGANNIGAIIEYDPATNTCVKKYDLNNVNPTRNGTFGAGSLMQATNGKLYGMTLSGGLNGQGVGFEFDIATSAYVKKFDFSQDGGGDPYGSLMQASNGKIYGMATSNGARNGGTIFEYDPATSVQVKKVDFLLNGNGSAPVGELVQGYNGKFYGMTYGGANFGTLFEYDPITLTFTKKIDFDGTNGESPNGSLTRANGKLYGVTASGGLNGIGVLFEYDPTSNAYTKKIDFVSDDHGSNPYGAPTFATNGKLYGTSFTGGPNGSGVLFEYDPITNISVKRWDFVQATGVNSAGSLIQTSNDKLYGMTSSGGVNSFGVIYEYDITTQTYTKKMDFDGAVTGSYPYGSLRQGANGKLYGITFGGGANNLGVLFEYDPSTNTYIKKQDFAGTSNGSYPFGSLVLSSNGKLYGVTRNGGTSDKGVVFEYDPVTNTLTKKKDLIGANGAGPGYNSGLAVLKNSQTITFNTPVDKTIGDAPFNLAGTSSSGLPLTYTASSNKITIAGSQVTLVSAGRVTVSALQAGDINNLEAPVSISQSFCIKPAKPTVTFSNSNPASPTLTSNASSGNQWYLNGTAISGETNTTLSITQAGTYKVQVQADDCISEFSTDQSFATQTITFGALADKVLGDTPFALTGTTSSGLSLSYTASSNKVSITGNQVSLVSAGRVTITASQPGAIGFLQAASVSQSFCIKPGKPAIALSNTNPESPTLTSSASAGNQWFLNGTAIAGATNTTLSVTQIGTYKVKVQVDDCVSDFSDDQAIIVTGDIQKNTRSINIYPNPVTDWLTVKLGNSSGQKGIAIYQLTGKKMTSQQVSTDEAGFYVADYTNGIYVVKITTGDAVSVIRFVKQ